MAIGTLPLETRNLLQSAQAAVSPDAAVKELVENALDANATTLEISVSSCGLTAQGIVSVRDNGTGISAADAELLGKPHSTSKIAAFDDLTRLTTYGFRGEAVHSIMSIAGTFMVATRCAGEDTGRVYTYGEDGSIDERSTCAMQVGTTITITDMFHSMPVRRQQYTRRISALSKRIRRLVSAYSLVYPHVGFQLKVLPSKKVDDYFTKPAFTGDQDMLKGIYHTFPKLSGILQYFEVKVPILKKLDEYDTTEDIDNSNNEDTQQTQPDTVIIKMAVPKPGMFLQNFEELFFYVNNRPVTTRETTISTIQSRLREAFNETVPLNSHLGKSNPSDKSTKGPKLCFAFVHIQLPFDMLDVNVEPDKSTVLLQDSESVLNAIDVAVANSYPGSIRAAFTDVRNTTKSVEVQKRRRFTASMMDAVPSNISNDSATETSVSPRDMIIPESTSVEKRPLDTEPNLAIADIQTGEPLQKKSSHVEEQQEEPISQMQQTKISNFSNVTVRLPPTNTTRIRNSDNIPRKTYYLGADLDDNPQDEEPKTNEVPPPVARLEVTQVSNPRVLRTPSPQPTLAHASMSLPPPQENKRMSLTPTLIDRSVEIDSVRKQFNNCNKLRINEELDPIKPPSMSPFKRTRGTVINMPFDWNQLTKDDMKRVINEAKLNQLRNDSSMKNKKKNRYPEVIGLTYLNGTVVDSPDATNEETAYLVAQYVCPGLADTTDLATKENELKKMNLWAFSVSRINSVFKEAGLELINIGLLTDELYEEKHSHGAVLRLEKYAIKDFNMKLKSLWRCIAGKNPKTNMNLHVNKAADENVKMTLISARKKQSYMESSLLSKESQQENIPYPPDINETQILKICFTKETKETVHSNCPPAEATGTGDIHHLSDYHKRPKQIIVPIALNIHI